jgi:hypothetical protein
LIGDADDIQMHDVPTIRSRHDINDAPEERLDRITRGDQPAGARPLRLLRYIQKRPHVTGVVDLLYIGRDRGELSLSHGDVVVVDKR